LRRDGCNFLDVFLLSRRDCSKIQDITLFSRKYCSCIPEIYSAILLPGPGTVLYYPGCITLTLLHASRDCSNSSDIFLCSPGKIAQRSRKYIKLFSSLDGLIILDILLSILQAEIALKFRANYSAVF
jgi:hypothetical protein